MARNQQNGVSFDPAEARREREKARIIQEAQEREFARKQHQENMRNHGRMLDQIEACYRQHIPAQNCYQGPRVEKHGGMLMTMTAEDFVLQDEVWQAVCYDHIVDAS